MVGSRSLNHPAGLGETKRRGAAESGRTGGFAAALNSGSLTSPTLEGNVALSAGDLDETIQAFIDSAGTSGAGGGADVTFARLRAFRDGFFNGFGGCEAKYADRAISFDGLPR